MSPDPEPAELPSSGEAAAAIFPDGEALFDIQTTAEGPSGALPFTEEMLRNSPSGDLFGLSQNAGMGWPAALTAGKQILILSTQGGMRAADGSPLALGFHTGHWEIALQVAAAAQELRRLEVIPFAAYCSDPCDGRTQGTNGMFDSLPYRNDAAVVFRRLIRSLPRRAGVIGVATCDKGLPAMMMALAGTPDLPSVIVPGGVTLPPRRGEDAGAVQTLGARFSRGMLTVEEAADLGCRACATPGGGCQFMGTAATSQVVAEGLGMALPHTALAPSGQAVWTEIAAQAARAVLRLGTMNLTMGAILSPGSIRNAMALHAAFGGSTNLLLHIPAIAHAARLPRPTVRDWTDINRSVPRLVDVLPNGPQGHPTVRVFLAGGVPEVMLHLRTLGLLDTSALTVTGQTVGQNLDAWRVSRRRAKFRALLRELDGIEPDEVIFSPQGSRDRGLARTLLFPVGNLAPEGSVIKATAMAANTWDAQGRYDLEGEARVFLNEASAMAALRLREVRPGNVIVLCGVGPMGSGMEETYQITSALKTVESGSGIALLTDGRFSGVSTGACIGHVGPEALAGGPIGKLRDGDRIRIRLDRAELSGSVDLVGEGDRRFSPEEGAAVLRGRSSRPDLCAHPALPDDTKLWATLQAVSGGAWAGCVYDHEAIAKACGNAVSRAG